MSGRVRTGALAAAIALAGAACGGDDAPPAIFPEDYAATYTEVRDCRFSLDHDLTRMRVLVSPDAVAVYEQRSAPFPAGAIVVKEQYDSRDTSCAGPIIEFTVMRKLPAGSSPATLDWEWQKVEPDLREAEFEVERCTRCHTGCGQAPEGHDGTCAME